MKFFSCYLISANGEKKLSFLKDDAVYLYLVKDKFYFTKRNDNSSQHENKAISIRFTKILVYWHYLYAQINYVYWLICVRQSKNLKKLDKIVHNLSEKDREGFREMLQREELLG